MRIVFILIILDLPLVLCQHPPAIQEIMTWFVAREPELQYVDDMMGNLAFYASYDIVLALKRFNYTSHRDTNVDVQCYSDSTRASLVLQQPPTIMEMGAYRKAEPFSGYCRKLHMRWLRLRSTHVAKPFKRHERYAVGLSSATNLLNAPDIRFRKEFAGKNVTEHNVTQVLNQACPNFMHLDVDAGSQRRRFVISYQARA